MLSVEDNQLK